MARIKPDKADAATSRDGAARDAIASEAQPGAVNRRYDDMLRSVADWLWETDPRLDLTYVSPPIATAFGVPAQVLIGRNIQELFGPGEDDGNEGGMATAIQARQPFRDEPMAIDSVEGVRSTYRVTGVPYYDERTGRFAGYRGTGTELARPPNSARAEKDTAGQLLEMLEAALARKDQLEWELSRTGDGSFRSRLASLAHELRTPLNAIIGFAEVIKERHLGDEPGRYSEYAGDIHDSSLHLLEIINGLLDQARIEAEAVPAETGALDLTEVAAGVVRMLEDEARDSDVLLINDVAADTPSVKAEGRAVRQILINLLGNAIKYTPAGGAAGIESRVESGGMVALLIWDTGVGIAPENQEKVFQRSYRVTQTGLERPGSGLGLSISRDLARAMGGDITISSRLGEGSRVTLSLPAGPTPQANPSGSD